jgi:hypothetical protein
MNGSPKHLSPNPETAHSVFIPECNLCIPLVMQGVISGIPIRKPSEYELENCPWVSLTSDEVWSPQTQILAEREKAYENGTWIYDTVPRFIDAITEMNQHPIDLVASLSPHKFFSRVNVSVKVKHAQSSRRQYKVSASELAHLWNIGLTTAE